MAAGLLFSLTGAAFAQAAIDAGKSPAQLFASDCTPCHKTPQGLAKSTMGLSEFLRQHYVASRQNADALASYLQGVGEGRPQAAPARKRDAKPATAKKDESKPEATPASAKPDEKPAESKPAEVKPAESKPAEAKPAEAKPAEAKPVEAKPAD